MSITKNNYYNIEIPHTIAQGRQIVFKNFNIIVKRLVNDVTKNAICLMIKIILTI